jgi:hypothetical protein
MVKQLATYLATIVSATVNTRYVVQLAVQAGRQNAVRRVPLREKVLPAEYFSRA